MIGTLLFFGGRRSTFPWPRSSPGAPSWAARCSSSSSCPAVIALSRSVRPAHTLAWTHVRTVLHNFFPVCLSRGVVQVSAYVDSLLATLLPVGSVAALTYAQVLYTLPISLFGMSMSAAELPAMSGAMAGREDRAAALRTRLHAGLRRIAFFVVPSAAAFLALGDVIAAALLQTGRFRPEDAVYVWGILAGVGDRAAGLDDGPAATPGVLRARRHAHAASLRARSRRARHASRVSLRHRPAAAHRDRRPVGRCGTDLVGGNCRLVRVRAAPAFSQPAHWRDRGGGRATGDAVGGRRGRRGGRLASADCEVLAAPHHPGGAGARSVRSRLPRRRRGPGSPPA